MQSEKQQNDKIKRIFTGIVMSDKADKTIVVKVERTKINSKYKKHYITSKNYKVHDENNNFHIGDKVTFVECRPLSKDKRWRVI
ncbi:MAG: 30S ribosomal protein S17 [bacterium]